VTIANYHNNIKLLVLFFFFFLLLLFLIIARHSSYQQTSVTAAVSMLKFCSFFMVKMPQIGHKSNKSLICRKLPHICCLPKLVSSHKHILKL